MLLPAPLPGLKWDPKGLWPCQGVFTSSYNAVEIQERAAVHLSVPSCTAASWQVCLLHQVLGTEPNEPPLWATPISRSGNYTRLVLQFELRRNVLYFILETYVPSTFLVVLSWISFWISLESVPARTCIGNQIQWVPWGGGVI